MCTIIVLWLIVVIIIIIIIVVMMTGMSMMIVIIAVLVTVVKASPRGVPKVCTHVLMVHTLVVREDIGRASSTSTPVPCCRVSIRR